MCSQPALHTAKQTPWGSPQKPPTSVPVDVTIYGNRLVEDVPLTYWAEMTEPSPLETVN